MAALHYPVATEPGTDTTVFGVIVPDLPGCFSAGDTLDEALAGAVEAAAGWIEVALETGQTIPEPSSIAAFQARSGCCELTYEVVKIDPGLLNDARHFER